MGMPEKYLDATLVPAGVILMGLYHVYLVYKIAHHPKTTVIGLNNINRRLWVHAIMKERMKNGVLAVQTIRNSIMASTLLASTAITLCSVVGLLLGVGNRPDEFTLYGRTGSVTSSLKCMLVLVCFLVAFVCHAQCVRYYSHVSFLITTPPPLEAEMEGCDAHAEYVSTVFNKGAYFWSLGLRAFYFSLPLFLWNFGPIPMFVCSCCLLSFLHSLDTTNSLSTFYNNGCKRGVTN
ncbi:hypothetical protein SUGI_0826170 [Cryptomeria japonica]|uniref:uncharacterized protein LOC131035861 n=1 Tax=Cryptomeria japonica TaxID=3369 RepID=UPI002414A9B8|nr:uncharacterized protein LOC131035861 [Cryptomeria japonica]XP_057823590.2 uncharacterized protein LOC131035861 [Cryptomeria japonica]GLJ40241.1 hypothetical protein SUGI_0826170 [Cryptomeria japonica]